MAIAFVMFFTGEIIQIINSVLMAILTIGQFIPLPALVTRRLHDLNISGWWAVVIVPLFFGSFIGVFLWLFMAIFVLVFMVLFLIFFSLGMVFVCAIFVNKNCSSSLDNLWKLFDNNPIAVEFWLMAVFCCLSFVLITTILSLKGTQGNNRYGGSLENQDA